MHRFITALVLTICANFSDAGIAADSTQSLQLSEKVVDFGSVAVGETATREVVIANRSSLPAEITKVSTSCGCARAEAKQSTIEPGKTATIAIQLRPTRMGRHTSNVFISAEIEGRLPPIILSVKYEGVSGMPTTPDRIQFGSVVRGTEPQQTVQLQLPEQGQHSRIRVKYNEQLFVVKQKKRSDDSSDKVLQLIVALRADAPYGSFHKPLLIYLFDGENSEPKVAVVMISAQVSDEFTAAPTELKVQLAPGESTTRTVIVRNTTEELLPFASAECSLSDVAVSVRVLRGSVAVLNVTITAADTLSESISGELVIHLKSSPQSRLAIPLSISPR